MYELSHFHFRKSQKSPMWRHQLPGDMEGELLDDLQFLITLTPPCHHKDGVSFIGSGNFFFFH